MVSSDGQVVTAGMRVGSDRSLAIPVFTLLAGASLLPVLLTPSPAMVDYRRLSRTETAENRAKPSLP